MSSHIIDLANYAIFSIFACNMRLLCTAFAAVIYPIMNHGMYNDLEAIIIDKFHSQQKEYCYFVGRVRINHSCRRLGISDRSFELYTDNKSLISWIYSEKEYKGIMALFAYLMSYILLCTANRSLWNIQVYNVQYSLCVYVLLCYKVHMITRSLYVQFVDYFKKGKIILMEVI